MNTRSQLRATDRANRMRQDDPPAAQALAAYLGGMALATVLVLTLAGAAAEILKHAL